MKSSLRMIIIGIVIVAGCSLGVAGLISAIQNKDNTVNTIDSESAGNNIIDSVSAYEAILEGGIIHFNMPFKADDYESIAYYSDDTVVAKIIGVQGVSNPELSDKVYLAQELQAEFPEIDAMLTNRVDNSNTGGKDETIGETTTNSDDRFTFEHWTTIWNLEIQSVIDGENFGTGEVIQLVTPGFPNTTIDGEPRFRDNDVLVLPLYYSNDGQRIYKLPIDRDYLIKTNLLRSGNGLPTQSEAYNELEQLSDVPKEELNPVQVSGSETEPPKEGR